MRRRALLAICFASLGCDPVPRVGIAVVPESAPVSEKFRHDALAVLSEIANSHGLHEVAATSYDRCFARENIFLCAKADEEAIAFQLRQSLTWSFTPLADSIHKELGANLRARFGDGSIRKCEWAVQRDGETMKCELDGPIP